MVYFGGFVVCFCGFDFIFEISEGDSFAICGDFGDELLFAGVEAYTFVFRAGIFSFFRVAVVLSAGGWAKVCPTIVETIMVDVVNDMARGDFYDTAVHVNRGRVFSGGGVALSVKCVTVLGEVPIVFAERFVIFRVNEGKFTLCKGYSAKRIAIAESAKGEYSKDQYAF